MSSGHYEWGDYLPKSNYDSTSEQLPNSSPLQAQSVVLYSQNHPSESSSNIDNSRDDMSGYGVVIPIKDDEEEEQRPPSLWVHAHEGISEFLYVGFIVGVLPSLIGLNQLKFQNKSPSKTDGVLFYMAAVALAIVMLASIPILYMRTRLDSTIKKTFYTILKSIFCFSCILAPLSLVLMLIF